MGRKTTQFTKPRRKDGASRYARKKGWVLGTDGDFRTRGEKRIDHLLSILKKLC